jgi:hypothetical protein
MTVAEVVSDRQFYVPGYQRGYRWTEDEVRDLLQDLLEFIASPADAHPGKFYCLQPIVVKRREDASWELVDGQQRLTTLYLLLGCLEPGLPQRWRFHLEYETRCASAAFLREQRIDLGQERANVDFFHICKAVQAIEKELQDRAHDRDALLRCLKNSDPTAKTVKLIWYELSGASHPGELGADPVEAFTRLNVGKIALTNAELIRALFLRTANFGPHAVPEQLRIAQEWDSIEKRLQSEPFWYFLQNEQNREANRIEFIFDTMAHPVEDGDDDADIMARPAAGKGVERRYATFHDFAARPDDFQSQWHEVKRHFLAFEEWFEDRVLYHLAGFLIHEGAPVQRLLVRARNRGKAAFERWLRRRIFKYLTGRELTHGREALAELLAGQIDELDYEHKPRRIRSWLLLFNIASILVNKASNLRFPFDLFKDQAWDIEHIRSVASRKPDNVPDQKKWLQVVASYAGDNPAHPDLLAEIDALLKAPKFDSIGFDALYSRVVAHYEKGDGADVDNSIANLTLLDAETNRSYKNAVFPLKRQRILGLDRRGVFVPHCTRNVFLKCYSRKLDPMVLWTPGDRDDYRSAIVDTLAKFFEGSAA